MNRLVKGAIVAGALTVASPFSTSLVAASPSAALQAAPARSATPNDIVATAQRYLGSPYATIGNTPAGFSCIGFVNFVFKQNGINVPFDIPMAWSSAPHVGVNELLPGDVLFYANTVFPGLSHVAIFIGNDQMIGADSFATGVSLDRVSASYWASRYYGATRPLAQAGSAPMPGTSAAQATPVATAIATPPPIAASAPPGATLQGLSSSVQVYSGPGYQYTPIASVPATQTMIVLQAQASWYHVRFSGTTYGWVSAGDVHAVAANAPKTQAAPAQQPYAQAAAISGTAAGSVMIVTQGPLWIRTGPGRNYSPVGTLKKGTRLTVLGLSAPWVHVTAANGMAGWVALQYVTPAGTASAAQASSVAPAKAIGALPAAGGVTPNASVRVAATVLNVRVMPDNHARVLTVLFQGERVLVMSRQGTWAQIRLKNGDIGWASAEWLSAR